MLKKIFILIALLPLIMVSTGKAQGVLRLAEVEVDLWPEYDRPDVLVIYHIKLPGDVSLPVDVVVRIPAVAGDPHAVAVRQMDGALLNAAYKRQVEGEWARITVTATMPEIQLEYYDPQIEREGNLRRYSYAWFGEYPVDMMRIVVQQPGGATQMRIEPDLGFSTQFSGDPMQYYVMDVGSPRAADLVSVEIAYLKDSDALSIESMQVEPSAPINGNTGEQPELLVYLPWLIGGLGVILLAGGGIWYWRLNHTETLPKSKKRGRGSRASIKSPEQLGAENGGQEIYCHQCGKRASSRDRFCRVCGTKLRES